jgi:hypothetical protein
MGSFRHPRVFHPLDLEIIDGVYEVAWAGLEASDPFRDRARDDERKEALRKLVMDCTETDRVDFDTLCDRVIGSMPDNWVVFTRPRSAQDLH